MSYKTKNGSSQNISIKKDNFKLINRISSHKEYFLITIGGIDV